MNAAVVRVNCSLHARDHALLNAVQPADAARALCVTERGRPLVPQAPTP